MNFVKTLLSLSLLSGILFFENSCTKIPDPLSPEETLAQQLSAVDKTQLDIDLQIIDDSLFLWGITPLIETHGVRYTIDSLGAGIKPALNNIIDIKYAGLLLKDGQNGTPFDQSESLVYFLADLIVGIKTTLTHVPQGSKATLYIPSGYAYGTNEIRDQNTGSIIIPKNSNLIFRIKLTDVR